MARVDSHFAFVTKEARLFELLIMVNHIHIVGLCA